MLLPCSIVSGDTTKIVTSVALNAGEVLTAPVVVENNGTLGAWAVVLPGVTVGQQATLAPLTIPELGSNLRPKTVYLGAPAQPVKVHPAHWPDDRFLRNVAA